MSTPLNAMSSLKQTPGDNVTGPLGPLIVARSVGPCFSNAAQIEFDCCGCAIPGALARVKGRLRDLPVLWRQTVSEYQLPSSASSSRSSSAISRACSSPT